MGKLALVALLVVGLLVALVFSVPVIRNDPGGSVDAYAVEAEKMGWMPLSPTASQCAKLVVLDSQGKREGIHE